MGLTLAVALMWLASRGVAWSDVRRELAGAHYGWFVPAAASIFVGQTARAVRWRKLFGDAPKPGVADAFAILSIGYLLSNLLPLRLGDPVRAWLVDTRTPGDGAQALATVLAERVVDFLAIGLLLGVWVPAWGAAFVAEHTSVAVPTWLLSVATVGAVIVGIAVLAAASAAGAVLERAARSSLQRVGVSPSSSRSAAAGVRRFAEGFSVLRSLRRSLVILAWSVAVWLIGAVGYWFMFRAFEIDLPMSAATFTVAAAALAAAFLPPAPGYVGAFHASVASALNLNGIAPAASLSYALALHGLTFAMLMAMGAVGFWRLGVTWASLESRVVGAPDPAFDGASE